MAARHGSIARRVARLAAGLVAAVVLATIGPAALPAVVPAAVVRAAEDGLSLVSTATYALDPEAGVVHVTIEVTAANRKPNVTTGGTVTRYYYEGASFAIHEEAASIRATVGGTRLTTSVEAEDGFGVLSVRFRSNLFYNQSLRIRITYDLPGGAPRSESDIRVGSAFATFYAWAFGDSGDVRIVLPADFDEEVTGAELARSEADGRVTLAATGIAEPAEWYAVVVADRESSLTDERIELDGGRALVIRAWPEDEEWRSRVADLLEDGLPELVELIGLAWPVEDDLDVFEVHTPLLEGYAGFFIPEEDRIEISEDLDDLTILHEASHAWFNTDLFAERWIYEGFADEYAARALDVVAAGGWAPDPVDPASEAGLPLNEWRHPGRIEDEATNARESYGYEASWTVIRALVEAIGEDGMRRVIEAAAARTIPYVGAPEPEPVAGRTDWRRLLDLLEIQGGALGAEELYRRWIVTDAEADQLDDRAAARADYADLVAAGDGWLPPHWIRDLMARWTFGEATGRIATAAGILATRDEIAAVAESLGVEPPGSLRVAYETATADLDEARTRADEQRAAVETVAAAAAAVGAGRDALTTIGLIGETPEVTLERAKTAFAADDLVEATRDAEMVSALIAGAPDVGRTRVVAIAGGIVLLLLLVTVAVVLARRRGRRLAGSTAVALPAVASPSLAAWPDGPAGDPPYATLADQPTGTATLDPEASSPPPEPTAPSEPERPEPPARPEGDEQRSDAP